MANNHVSNCSPLRRQGERTRTSAVPPVLITPDTRPPRPPFPPSRTTTARRNTTVGIGIANGGAGERRAGASGIPDGEDDDDDDPQQRIGGGGGVGDGVGPGEFHPSRRPVWMRSGVASGVASSLAAAMETNAQFVFRGTMRGCCALLAILSLFLASCQIISLLQEQHEW